MSGLIHDSSSSSPDASGSGVTSGGGSERRGNGGDTTATPSRYEAQKRRDWNTFGQYLKNHRPPLALGRCSGAHVLEFLRYLDQFGKTKIHAPACPFFGNAHPPAPCACPLRQAWGSLDALIGRLRAAFEEHGGKPESNPFGTRAVRLYLREVRELQAKARGIAYEKKKRKRPGSNNASGMQNHRQQQQQQQAASAASSAAAAAAAAAAVAPHHHHLMVNIPHNLQQQQHPTIVHHHQQHQQHQQQLQQNQHLQQNHQLQVPLIQHQHQQLQHHQQQQQFLAQGLQILN